MAKSNGKAPKKLRTMWNSNAPWASSGYSMQMAEILPNVVAEGYPTACIDFFGLEGGKLNINGILHYPKMNHVYGSDAMIYHGQDFNTDVTFSLQDIWVLNDVDLQKVKRWCVDKDTLISFVDGTEIKIKDVVKNKINKPVWGYKNGKIVKSKILDWQEIQNKDVYEIKTDKRKILITGDNEVWVQSIMSRASALPPYINEPEWRRADCIIVGDMIYSIHNEPSNKEQDNKNTPTITNRMGIFSWFNRWGGNCNDNEGYEEKSKDGHTAYNTSINTDNEHRRENDRLDKKKAWGENEQQNKIYSKQIQDKYGKIYKIYENLLLCFNLGIQLLTHIGRSRALSDYKEGKGNINNKIYKISSGTTEEEVQSKIYKRGNRYMGEGAHIEPEIVVAIRKVENSKRTVYDISTETGNFFANKILIHNCPILPIDHDPAPKVIIDKLKYAYRIITYAKFGHEQLVKNGIHSTYIPHTVDTDIFKPMDKKERKRKAGLPEDAFVMGMVAANKDNPPRKSFQEVMDAFVIFLKKYPNSVLYLHTYPDFPGGFPLKQYADFLGIGAKVLYPSPYEINFNIDKQKMALIYNTLDILLMPSISEGFGVPAIEAQACGVPVIVNDFTSMPELIEPGVTGEVCEVLYRRFSHLGSYVAIPNAKSIYDCMIKIKEADREVMGKVARARMVENYNTKKVYREKWSPFLSKIEKEIYP